MTLEKIHAAIPHRAPMLLIDEILDQNKDSIVCSKTFHAEEFFLQGHYPGHPIVPGVILCEVGFQAGAVLLATVIQTSKPWETQGMVPVATRLNNVKFKHIVRPGDTIKADVTLTEQIRNAFYLQAKITCTDKIVTRFDFACTVAEPPATSSTENTA